MKMTMYFSSTEEMNNYFPSGIPSNVLAIVQPDAETPAALYTSSNNSPVGGGSSEEQGGGSSQTDWAETTFINWTNRFGPLLKQCAATVYQASDGALPEPAIVNNIDWRMESSTNGVASLTDMIAMQTLLIELYGGQSAMHSYWENVIYQGGAISEVERHIPIRIEVGDDDGPIYRLGMTNLESIQYNGILGYYEIYDYNTSNWYWLSFINDNDSPLFANLGTTNGPVDVVSMWNDIYNSGWDGNFTGIDIGNFTIIMAPIASWVQELNLFLKKYGQGRIEFIMNKIDGTSGDTISDEFGDLSAGVGYPCYEYNFGDFEYSGSGNQHIIGGQESGANNIMWLQLNMYTPLFSAEYGDWYVGGPATIEGECPLYGEPVYGVEGQIIWNEAAEVGPSLDVYINRSILNLRLRIFKPSLHENWKAVWTWELPSE